MAVRAIIERVKEIRERYSKLSIFDISRYIRAAGYNTKIHIYKHNFLGQMKGIEITGSKSGNNLKYKSWQEETNPEIVVSVREIDFIGRFYDFDIICPPDPELEDLELIVRETMAELFKKHVEAEPCSAN